MFIQRGVTVRAAVEQYRSLNAVMAQSNICLFGVNNTIELKNITTMCGNNGI